MTKAEGEQKTEESGKADYGQQQAAGDQAARVERSASKSEEKPSRKGYGRRAASDYSGAQAILRQNFIKRAS